MPFYNENLDEETLKERVRRDFFDKFSCEPLGKIDFSLKHKDDLLGIHHLLWAEAKAGSKESIHESFVQLILTIGVHNTHKKFTPPEFLAAFDCEKIAFLPYFAIKDFLYSGDFNWKKITPSDHTSKAFLKMLDYTKDILSQKCQIFDYSKRNDDLKLFIKTSLAKGKHNPIIIDTDNFDDCYLKWSVEVLPTIRLGKEWEKARKANIALEQDFFLADLISEDNESCNENLRILLRKTKQNKLYFEIKKSKDELFENEYSITKIDFIDENAHTHFWSFYTRPPAQKFWNEIVNRRDKITPRDIMERKGAFFTPELWVKKAQDYLTQTLGKGWQDEYYIWDLAAGTGNLLKGLTNSGKLFASTLDLSDVLIMKYLLKLDKNDSKKPKEQKLNLLENNVFAFDFLNDDFSKLPENLQEILKDEKKRQKLIIFINPPYAEAGDAKTQMGTGKHKDSVSLGNQIYEKYRDILGKASNELFAQFFIRIQQEIPNCILASFSTLKYLNSTNFAKFRESFKAEFKKGFMCPAYTFDNVKGEFPIGFLIWDLNSQKELKQIQLDIFGDNGEFCGKKNFYNYKEKMLSNFGKRNLNKNEIVLGHFAALGNDFQQQSRVWIENAENQRAKSGGVHIYFGASNLIEICVSFAVRKAIDATWLNDRDQFLYPNDKWIKDFEFQNDCLAFTLFHSQNRISSKAQNSSNFTLNNPPPTPPARGGALNKANQKSPSLAEGDLGGGLVNDKKPINHFIPFDENEISPKSSFKSNFMFEFINGKIKPPKEKELTEQGTLQGMENYTKKPKIQNFIPTKPLEFSIEAKAVFEAGRELWRYYHSQDFNDPQKPYNANASLYDIREYFQGVKTDTNGKPTMNPPNKAKDEHYKHLYDTLKTALTTLATKITPKIYEYGFLRE